MQDCSLTLNQVENLRQKIKLLDENGKVADTLNCLSSATRVKILLLLKYQAELSVCDMASILEMTVSAVSHQLRCLRDLDIVTTRRHAQTIYYSLGDNEVITKLLTLV